MSAAADCSVRWVDDYGKDHECYEDPDHDGGHQCGCGARVPAHLIAARERIDTALTLLRQVPTEGGYGCSANCWREHTDCLARRTIATLTGEDPTDAH